MAAEPVAQPEAAAVAAELGAQREAGVAVEVVESVAQQPAVATVRLKVRPLVSSVEFAATAVGQQRAASCSPMATMARQILAAAVRFWFRATSSLARAPR